MSNNLLQQARELLGRRRAQSDVRWLGQMGFELRDDQSRILVPFAWGPNRVVNQGLNHLLNAGLRGEGIISNFYIAPFVADITPTASLTAANFGSTLTEFTNYTEGARPQWVSDAAATAQLIENAAAPAVFTVGADAQSSIYGAALMSSNVKGGTAGILVAAAKSPSPFLNMAEGFEVRIKYRLTGSSS